MSSEAKPPGKPGAYLLVLRVEENLSLKTRSREFTVPSGAYVYIGSARGPGGIRARINRHLRRDKKLYWHIDYLLAETSVKLIGYAWCIAGEAVVDLESLFAQIAETMFWGVEGFGCSDKRSDYTHLYRCGDRVGDCIPFLEEIGIICARYGGGLNMIMHNK